MTSLAAAAPAGLRLVSSGPDADRRISVCVLITCFNRREKTLACLQALAVNRQSLASHYDVHAVLVDDGSTDGTARSVARLHSWVQVLAGEGGLYWCRGMHRAFERALSQGHDFYVWLNDDTMLRPDALQRLLRCERQLRVLASTPTIVVGSVVDPVTGALTYGGERLVSRWRRTTLARVVPMHQAQPLDSMNGNLVLINAEAARRVGNLDPAFEHAMGDTDYAMRARRADVGVWLAPGLHGSCQPNSSAGTYRDTSLPLSVRWQHMQSRKGLPWRSWMRFTRRHTGRLWPVFLVWPYAKLLVSGLGASRRT